MLPKHSDHLGLSSATWITISYWWRCEHQLQSELILSDTRQDLVFNVPGGGAREVVPGGGESDRLAPGL